MDIHFVLLRGMMYWILLTSFFYRERG